MLSEREYVLDFLERTCEGIAKMLGAGCETLIHDMSVPGRPILAIYNGHVSGRGIGSVLDIYGNEDINASPDVDKDYVDTLVMTNGRTIKSSTWVLRGEDYHYALGINFDISAFSLAAKSLTDFTSVGKALDEVISDDATSRIEDLYNQCLAIVGKPVYKMKKQDRLKLVELLHQKKAFSFQRSVPYVSERLNVSRYTIYQYLHEIDNKNE